MIFSYEQQTLQIQQFLSLMKIERNLSSLTLKSYSYDLYQFIDWHKNTDHSLIDQLSLIEYFDYLQTDQHLASKSILRKYASIKQFLSFLNEENYACEKFFRFNSRKFRIPHSLPKTLSLSEVKRLIHSTELCYNRENSLYRKALIFRDGIIIELLFCLGLRISEISNLSLQDYQEDDSSILIHSKGNRERLLYISSPVVIHKLSLWLTIYRPLLTPSSSAIFINRFGRTLSTHAIEDIFQKYRLLSGINPNATPHYLRHTFATHLLNNGASLRDVQEILGHKNISTTQIYTEISLKRKQEVLTKFNARNYLFNS